MYKAVSDLTLCWPLLSSNAITVPVILSHPLPSRWHANKISCPVIAVLSSVHSVHCRAGEGAVRQWVSQFASQLVSEQMSSQSAVSSMQCQAEQISEWWTVSKPVSQWVNEWVVSQLSVQFIAEKNRGMSIETVSQSVNEPVSRWMSK
jgi:hypothetical protein